MKLTTEQIKTIIWERDYQDLIDDLFETMKDEFGDDGFDAGDLSHAFNQLTLNAEETLQQNIKSYFGNQRMVENVRDILNEFIDSNMMCLNIQGMVRGLLAVEKSDEWVGNDWEAFVQDNVWAFIKGETHNLNVNSSGCMLEGMVR